MQLSLDGSTGNEESLLSPASQVVAQGVPDHEVAHLGIDACPPRSVRKTLRRARTRVLAQCDAAGSPALRSGRWTRPLCSFYDHVAPCVWPLPRRRVRTFVGRRPRVAALLHAINCASAHS